MTTTNTWHNTASPQDNDNAVLSTSMIAGGVYRWKAVLLFPLNKALDA